jgi:ParB family chromosome partitioning protein
MSADTPRRLGRGLEALISTAKQQRDQASASEPGRAGPPNEFQRVRIADITPNRFQPRRTFTEPQLAELEASIKASGLLQPITVRRRDDGAWELVAGERRLRAATRLGWTEIPAIVRDFDDKAMLTLALVENLQRSDLNPLEEAEGYQRLLDEFGLTQQQVADAVGKDRTTITNMIRVLSLAPPIRSLVEQGHITAGHARALLPLRSTRQQQDLANEIVARQLSVRQTEARARELNGQGSSEQRQPAAKSGHARSDGPASSSSDPAVRRIEEQLRRRLQTDVQVQQLGNAKGVVRISYYGVDDLERVLELVLGAAPNDFD